jgi:hypothetical protein
MVSKVSTTEFPAAEATPATVKAETKTIGQLARAKGS